MRKESPNNALIDMVEILFSREKSAIKCVLAERSYRPYRLFCASRETMAIDPDGEQNDQSDNPVNSEVVINCVAIFYEEGKGGENYRKKKSSVVW